MSGALKAWDVLRTCRMPTECACSRPLWLEPSCALPRSGAGRLIRMNPLEWPFWSPWGPRRGKRHYAPMCGFFLTQLAHQILLSQCTQTKAFETVTSHQGNRLVTSHDTVPGGMWSVDSPVKPSQLTLACEILKSLWLAVLFDFLNCCPQ